MNLLLWLCRPCWHPSQREAVEGVLPLYIWLRVDVSGDINVD